MTTIKPATPWDSNSPYRAFNSILPATPLPWKISGIGYLGNGDTVVAATEWTPKQYEAFPLKADDATYIVHACNAYPKLVEALRMYVHGDAGCDGAALLRSLGEEV